MKSESGRLETATALHTKKRKKKKSHSKAIPLVKGATAASLAKKGQTESSSSSRSSRRKRSRENAGGDSTNTNTNNKQNKLFSSTAESLAVISKFHTLNKRLEQNERDETLTKSEREAMAKQIQQEQEAMGGLDRYQKASMYGAQSSRFVCADWVVPLLRKQREKNRALEAVNNNNHQTKNEADRRLRILDVGAIDNQYHGKGYDDWLDAVPIDLHGGQHESVLQVDFFDYAHDYCSGTDRSVFQNDTNNNSQKSKSQSKQLKLKPKLKPRPFDAIVMSLVLNFQGDPRKRGDMVALAADPRLLKVEQGGMLFVVLPSASLENSRYCDLDRFVAVVTGHPLFRFELVEQKKSAKLVLLAFERTASSSSSSSSLPRKTKKDPPKQQQCCYNASKKTFDYGDHEMKRLHPAKPGAKRNNFAVILKSSHNRT